MSEQRHNVTNLAALVRVGAEFQFANGAASPAAARVSGYSPFGNIVDVTPNIDTQKVEHVSSNRGAPRKDREDITRSQIQFKVKTDEFNKMVQEIMLGGASGNPSPDQAALDEDDGDPIAFSSTNKSKLGNWYDLRKSGVRVRNLTAVSFETPALVEGTDYRVDLLLGIITFLTEQSVSVTPKLSAPQVDATHNPDLRFIGIKPGQQVKRTGIGRLLLFDQNTDNPVFADYQDFSCEITLDTASAFNATSFADLTFSVLVTDQTGNWQTRRAIGQATYA